MNRDAILIKGYLKGYMNKEAAQTPELPGQGMGPGMQPQGSGFPINPDMAMAAQNQDPNADAEQAQREENLNAMGKQLDDLKYQTEEQKLTGDIYKEKMKQQKQEEAMQQEVLNQQNDTSLGSMIGTASPGEV